MNSVIELLQNPLVWKILLAYWIFSAFVSALPMPKNGNQFYNFFFRFVHTLAGSVMRAAVSFKLPGADAADVPAPKP